MDFYVHMKPSSKPDRRLPSEGILKKLESHFENERKASKKPKRNILRAMALLKAGFHIIARSLKRIADSLQSS